MKYEDLDTLTPAEALKALAEGETLERHDNKYRVSEDAICIDGIPHFVLNGFTVYKKPEPKTFCPACGSGDTRHLPTHVTAYHCNSCDTDFTVLINREGKQ
jgi:hypothetical protein